MASTAKNLPAAVAAADESNSRLPAELDTSEYEKIIQLIGGAGAGARTGVEPGALAGAGAASADSGAGGNAAASAGAGAVAEEMTDTAAEPNTKRVFKQCVLVSGSAGTGKTTFIEYLSSDEGREALPIAENMGIVAPTGIAAMQAGGATIHSLFRFPPAAYDYESGCFVDGESVGEISRGGDVLRRMELLVIDEVSMVRADLMDAIDRSMRINRRVMDRPFGGVKLLLVGDIFQLQPVVQRNDREFLAARYEGADGMFFFNSLAVRELLAKDLMDAVELRIARRYINLEGKEDNFYHMLNRIRTGDTSDLPKINRWLARTSHCDKLTADNAVLLTGLRAAAERINLTKLEELPGQVRRYEGVAEGRCRDYEDTRLPAPRSLELKVGAQVIFVRNGPERKWYNGSLATIEEFVDVDYDADDDGVGVGSGGGFSSADPFNDHPDNNSARGSSIGSGSANAAAAGNRRLAVRGAGGVGGASGDAPADRPPSYIRVRLLDDNSVVEVKREEWQVMDYKFNRQENRIEPEEAGSYTQYPFMLAWAMTIHRAQGKTLGRVVIDLGRGTFSAGQAYVALSRCREAKDVGLLVPLRERDIICHPEVVAFYQTHIAK